MGEGALILSGKREVVGNLMAAQLGDVGVDFFSFGEYFEARPLITLAERGRVEVREHAWVNGATRRILGLGGVEFEECLALHGDVLVYSLVKLSDEPVMLRFRGSLQVFSWSNPNFRKIMAELANVSFRALRGLGLEASYRNTYKIYLASTHPMNISVRTAEATYGIDVELGEGKIHGFTFVAIGAIAGEEEEALEKIREIMRDPLSVRGRKYAQVKGMLERVRKLGEVKPEYALLWKYMWYVILSNRAHVRRHPVLKRPFTMPSKFAFRHQWLWDSAFHAIVLSMLDIHAAEEELLNIFEAQKPDGRIPHEIFLSKEFCKLFWKVDDYSPWTTQPPVIAIAVDYIVKRGASEDFVRRAFEALDSYDRWFRECRDADGDQLMAYVDYLESGWDDSVRWDEPIAMFERNPEYYKRLYGDIRMAPVEAVDLNCYICIQRRVLAKLAEELGLEDRAKEYVRLAKETGAKVREYMWDAETGFFYDITEEGHEQIKVKTPAAFVVLYAGLASKEQAERLVEHLLNPKEFWTTFPLPSVSADDPKYDPRGYWRGRSWLNMVWFAYWGLKRYGFEREARMLAEKALSIMSESLSCNENYNSLTGEPLGAPDYGWSTLMLDIIKDLSEG